MLHVMSASFVGGNSELEKSKLARFGASTLSHTTWQINFLTISTGTILVSSEDSKRAKTALSRDVPPVAHDPTAMYWLFTQRPRGLMEERTN